MKETSAYLGTSMCIFFLCTRIHISEEQRVLPAVFISAPLLLTGVAGRGQTISHCDWGEQVSRAGASSAVPMCRIPQPYSGHRMVSRV